MSGKCQNGASSHQISLQVASSCPFQPCTLPRGALTRGCDAPRAAERKLCMELLSLCGEGA